MSQCEDCICLNCDYRGDCHCPLKARKKAPKNCTNYLKIGRSMKQPLYIYAKVEAGYKSESPPFVVKVEDEIIPRKGGA